MVYCYVMIFKISINIPSYSALGVTGHTITSLFVVAAVVAVGVAMVVLISVGI